MIKKVLISISLFLTHQVFADYLEGEEIDYANSPDWELVNSDEQSIAEPRRLYGDQPPRNTPVYLESNEFEEE